MWIKYVRNIWICIDQTQKIQLDPLQQTAYVVCCFTKCKTPQHQSKGSKIGDLMLFDPHVKYAKGIGVEDTKIHYTY